MMMRQRPRLTVRPADPVRHRFSRPSVHSAAVVITRLTNVHMGFYLQSVLIVGALSTLPTDVHMVSFRTSVAIVAVVTMRPTNVRTDSLLRRAHTAAARTMQQTIVLMACLPRHALTAAAMNTRLMIVHINGWGNAVHHMCFGFGDQHITRAGGVHPIIEADERTESHEAARRLLNGYQREDVTRLLARRSMRSNVRTLVGARSLI
jgi:hypothetical protein